MGSNQRSQIVMSDQEVTEFINSSRTTSVATVGPGGQPHVVAMWYAVLNGEMWFETKAKSQKVVNLKRNPAITCLIDDGLTYDTLRGVSIEGQAEIIEDPDLLFQVGISIFERYTAPYTEEMKPVVEEILNNRIAVRVRPIRIRSWDHRKLGLPAMPVGGSTAPKH